MFLLVPFAPCVAGAQEVLSNEKVAVAPIITDRPDFTESTETVPVGMTQIEAGATWTRSGSERASSWGEVLIRHSLGRKTEMRIEAPTFSRLRGAAGNSRGFEDGSIGFKQVLSQGSGKLGLRKPRISVIGATSLPLGSRDLRQSRLQPEAKLLFGWDLSEKISLSSNLNLAFLRENGERFREWSASLSLGYSLTEKTASYVEIYGFAPNGGRARSQFINGGFTHHINDDFQLDARLGFGIDNDVAGKNSFFGLGVARRF